MTQKGPWRPWGDHPFVVLVSVCAGVLAISAPFIPWLSSKGSLIIYSTDRCLLSVDGEESVLVGNPWREYVEPRVKSINLETGPDIGAPVERWVSAGTHVLVCKKESGSVSKKIHVEAGKRNLAIMPALDIDMDVMMLGAEMEYNAESEKLKVKDSVFPRPPLLSVVSPDPYMEAWGRLNRAKKLKRFAESLSADEHVISK